MNVVHNFIIKNSIWARNNWFNSLSTKQKRIEIAKDVIQQVHTQKYHPHSTYFNFTTFNIDNEKPLQKLIDKHGCSVCAMGAVFASKVRLGNACNLKRSIYSTEIVENLDGIFSEPQLRLMEVAFEGCLASRYAEKVSDQVNHGIIFNQRYNGDKVVIMISIMQNIIKNEGVFRPDLEFIN